MDVVITGAQVPFASGGAELHMANLVSAVRDAGHRADIVRLPVAWEKERLFDSPVAWRMVPIDADLVIATNFPSYFVRHRHKVVWLFHQHRPAYELAGTALSDIDEDDTSFEVQRMLTEWDNRALGEAERIFTTSGVVADRLARYNGLSATPLYHPPPLHDRLHSGPSGDYVFCPTRLERNKRPDRIADALAHIRPPVRAVLAGSGTLADDLRAAAQRQHVSDRLDLLGFVSDERLLELYANALAVVYAPIDEDYGYVTLQAFLAGKPVITSSDSGGVLEWVEDGVTGLVTDGSPAGIGDAVERLAADRAFAATLGENGRKRVANLAWPPVVDELLGL